jgi:hypothetical protein
MNMLELLHAASFGAVRFLASVGKAGPGLQGLRVFRAGHPLDDGQQRGVLVAAPAASCAARK